MNIVPTDLTAAFWTQVTSFEGTDYLLTFRYNHRENCYYMNVALTDQTVLAQGIKLVSNYRLFQAYSDDRMPPGELVALAFGDDDSPAQKGELGEGQRVQLVYVTHDESKSFGFDGWREKLVL